MAIRPCPKWNAGYLGPLSGRITDRKARHRVGILWRARAASSENTGKTLFRENLNFIDRDKSSHGLELSSEDGDLGIGVPRSG